MSENPERIKPKTTKTPESEPAHHTPWEMISSHPLGVRDAIFFVAGLLVGGRYLLILIGLAGVLGFYWEHPSLKSEHRAAAVALLVLLMLAPVGGLITGDFAIGIASEIMYPIYIAAFIGIPIFIGRGIGNWWKTRRVESNPNTGNPATTEPS